jgi:hypothetical protein
MGETRAEMGQAAVEVAALARAEAWSAEGSTGPAMIAHVVLFRPKPHLTADARRRLVDGFTRAIREIPQIRRARIGRRVTHGRPYEQLMRADYSYAAVLEFDDVDGLKGYLAHHAHEALGAAFFECFEDTLIYDYEMGEPATQLPLLMGG